MDNDNIEYAHHPFGEDVTMSLEALVSVTNIIMPCASIQKNIGLQLDLPVPGTLQRIIDETVAPPQVNNYPLFLLSP